VAKRQNPPRTVQTPANKLNTARKDFISAMKELAEEQIPNNPHTALVEEVLPEWRIAGSKPAPATARFRFQTGTSNEAAKRAARRRKIIEQWARRFWLLGTDGEPADWIVAHAEELCQKLSCEWRDGPTRLGHPNVHPGQGFHQLSFHMTDASPRPGEAFADFRKRARQALTVYLRHLESTYGLKKAVVRAGPKIAGNFSPRSLEHFRWLVLYQCCKWKVDEIRAVSGHIEFDAVYTAIALKADSLQISLRPSRA
jgi:hypothetical protein